MSKKLICIPQISLLVSIVHAKHHEHEAITKRSSRCFCRVLTFSVKHFVNHNRSREVTRPPSTWGLSCLALDKDKLMRKGIRKEQNVSILFYKSISPETIQVLRQLKTDLHNLMQNKLWVTLYCVRKGDNLTTLSASKTVTFVPIILLIQNNRVWS